MTFGHGGALVESMPFDKSGSFYILCDRKKLKAVDNSCTDMLLVELSSEMYIEIFYCDIPVNHCNEGIVLNVYTIRPSASVEPCRTLHVSQSLNKHLITTFE